MSTRVFSKDEIFEILIVQSADRIGLYDAIEKVLNRPPEPLEIIAVSEKILEMRKGWVAMNIRTRGK